jgi:glutathione-regulated potassium-efflux system ancillary protein KefG
MSNRRPPRILLLFVHPFPHRSKVNHMLLERVRDLPGVEISDLYERYPDFHIDIYAEQQRLRDIDLLVVQHPFYWYSAPAMLKQWQDTVLEYGFAFGTGGTVLHGKDWLSVVTVGQSAQAYLPDGRNRHTVEELLFPYECAANHCGMRYLEPFVIPGAQRLDEDEMAQWADAYRRRLSSYRPGGERADG